jgi:single-strand selective monofunctional uracil DNA glycosylase
MELGTGAPSSGGRTVVDVQHALTRRTKRLRFGPPAAFVYQPLEYARALADTYAARFGAGSKECLFVGMNPGPFGMAQTGVPFGDVRTVRDWMGLGGPVRAPRATHPKRPVLGLDCPRIEPSGARFWGAIGERHTAESFFERAFVWNYCPLLFLDAGGANVTPNKLSADEREALERVCDDALRHVVAALRPVHVIGVGVYAAERSALALDRTTICILHPSPANPRAHRGWSEAVRATLAAENIRGLL